MHVREHHDIINYLIPQLNVTMDTLVLGMFLRNTVSDYIDCCLHSIDLIASAIYMFNLV